MTLPTINILTMMMKASCQPGMVIGMGHQHQQAGRGEARNGDKHGFRYFAQCTAPLTSRCKSGIWTLDICQPLKRPNFPTSIISHLPSNMYCGGPELFLNPGEDRLEDSYWSQDCVFCISEHAFPLRIFRISYFGVRIFYFARNAYFCGRDQRWLGHTNWKTNGPSTIKEKNLN